MKLTLLLASLAALAVGSTVVYRAARRLVTYDEEPPLTEQKRAAYSSAPADAEQRLRDAIGSGRR